MFTINDKEYDQTTLSDKGKANEILEQNEIKLLN